MVLWVVKTYFPGGGKSEGNRIGAFWCDFLISHPSVSSGPLFLFNVIHTPLKMYLILSNLHENTPNWGIIFLKIFGQSCFFFIFISTINLKLTTYSSLSASDVLHFHVFYPAAAFAQRLGHLGGGDCLSLLWSFSQFSQYLGKRQEHPCSLWGNSNYQQGPPQFLLICCS